MPMRLCGLRASALSFVFDHACKFSQKGVQCKCITSYLVYEEEMGKCHDISNLSAIA
jgi:hypothetical protein